MVDWRDAWRYSLGGDPPVDYPPHYVGSIFFLIITTLVGSSLRVINRAVTPAQLRGPVADFISTFQTCASSLENAHVLKHYGFPGLSVYVFIQCVIFIVTYGDSQASPTGNFQRWFDGELPVNNALFRIALQILAAYVSYKYALAVWAMDLLPEHKVKLAATECMTDLNVSLLTGFGLETGATLLDTWMGMQIILSSQRLDTGVKAAAQTTMIVLGKAIQDLMHFCSISVKAITTRILD